MKAQTRLPRPSHRTLTSIKTGGESKSQNEQENIRRRLRGSIDFEPRQAPGIGKDLSRGLKGSQRKLLQMKLILQSFRHQELSSESGPDGIVERLVNVRARIRRYGNLSQRDQSVGYDRKGEKAQQERYC
jgi:hypothetical protein